MCCLNLGNIVFMHRHAPRWLVTFARPSVFRLQTHAPPSSRSHQRLFLHVSSFLFTIGSCQDITPVVTELLRQSAIPSFQMGSDRCRGRAPLWRGVDCLGARPQSRQILRVERPQGRCHGSPDPYNSFLHAWAEQRDPQFSANKQSGTSHR